MRRLTVAVLGVVVVAGAAVGLLAFLSSRDSSTFRSDDGGPGRAYADQGHSHLAPGARARFRYDSDPPTSGPHVALLPHSDRRPLSPDELLQSLELGDVVILYPRRSMERALTQVAVRLAGRFDRALVAAGQAVLLDFRPGTPGLTAAAWAHLQPIAGPGDLRLRAFIQAWLGRGAGG